MHKAGRDDDWLRSGKWLDFYSGKHAPHLDAMPSSPSAAIEKLPWRIPGPSSKLLDFLALHRLADSCRAVELGCGTGENLVVLAEVCRFVMGIDIVPAAVEHACAALAGRDLPPSRAQAMVADILNIDPEQPVAPAGDGGGWRFDLAVDVQTFQCLWMVDKKRAGAAVASLIAPGGLLLLVTGHAENDEGERGPVRLTKAELLAAFPSLVCETMETERFADNTNYRRQGFAKPPLCWVTVWQKPRLPLFRRPRADDLMPTRHLFLVIDTRKCGAPQAETRLATMLPGDPIRVAVAGERRAYVTFATPSQAAACLAALSKKADTRIADIDIHHAAFAVAEERTDKSSPVQTHLPEDARSDLGEHSIPGLAIVRDFVSVDEERALVDFLDARRWLSHIRRRVQHFGYTFRYDTRAVAEESLGPIPAPLAALSGRVTEHEVVQAAACREDLTSIADDGYFDQITANEYPPGVGIAPHVDTHSAFHECLASVSLGSDTVMSFVRPRAGGTPATSSSTSTTDVKRRQQVHVFLPRRSLLLLTGEARLLWSHGIAYRTIDVVDGEVRRRSRRVSLTLRRVRRPTAPATRPVCDCKFPACCDSAQPGGRIPRFRDTHKK